MTLLSLLLMPSGAALGAPKLAEPGIFVFVSSLCGIGKGIVKSIRESSAVCVSSNRNLRIDVSLVENPEFLMGTKFRTEVQLYSCAFQYQRTETTNPGVSGDASFTGLAPNSIFKEIKGSRGKIFVFTVQAFDADRSAVKKGAESFRVVSQVVKAFNRGAPSFFQTEPGLRPIDCP